MEYQNVVKISPRFEKSDYTRINLNQNSNIADWQKAVTIFTDRIEGRFVCQIDMMLCDVNQNGFAVMAIVCLLIEALAQFKEGRDTTIGVSQKIYVSFLQKDLSNSFDSKEKAGDFYKKIRCGILHSAQTVAGARLTDAKKSEVEYQDKVLLVPVQGLVNEVKQFIERYKEELGDPNNIELRKNFIKKMDFICKK